MQDNLPELRDIHLPSGDISFFPLAYGWWVLAGVLAAVVLLAWLTRFLLQRSKKRYALKLLPRPADRIWGRRSECRKY